jgi:hypothetical protein
VEVAAVVEGVAGVLDCSPDDFSPEGFDSEGFSPEGFDSVPPFSDSRAFLRAAEG